MSKRVTEKDTLDFYTDFLVPPTVGLDTGGDTITNRWRAIHYGTGYTGVVNPWSMGNSEAGHPGIGKLTMNTAGLSDNAQCWLKCGTKQKFRDFTRYTCTFKIGQLMTSQELAWLNVGLAVDSAWPQCSCYIYNATWYANPFGWLFTTISDGQPGVTETYRGAALVGGVDDTDRLAQLVAWHNIDIRLDYEQGTVKFYLDGTLIDTQVPNASVWDKEGYPGLYFGDASIENAVLYVDELGWSCRRTASDVTTDSIEKSLPSGTTRTTNQG